MSAPAKPAEGGNPWASEKILTHYDPKPIPIRQFDWCAARESYEPDMPIGWGATEKEAIAELLMIEDDRYGD